MNIYSYTTKENIVQSVSRLVAVRVNAFDPKQQIVGITHVRYMLTKISLSSQSESKTVGIINSHCVQQYEQLRPRQPNSDPVPFIPFSVQSIHQFQFNKDGRK